MILQSCISWSLHSLEFANQSLAQLTHENEGYLSYTLHDVIMAYLKNNITPEEQKFFHLQLVQKYSEKRVSFL